MQVHVHVHAACACTCTCTCVGEGRAWRVGRRTPGAESRKQEQEIAKAATFKLDPVKMDAKEKLDAKLEGKIGAPDPNVGDAMAREHMESKNALVKAGALRSLATNLIHHQSKQCQLNSCATL